MGSRVQVPLPLPIFIYLVSPPYFPGYGKREYISFTDPRNRSQFETEFRYDTFHDSRSGPDDNYSIAYLKVVSLQFTFGYFKIRKIIGNLTRILPTEGSFGTVYFAPFSEPLSEIIPIPKTAIEYRSQPGFPGWPPPRWAACA